MASSIISYYVLYAISQFVNVSVNCKYVGIAVFYFYFEYLHSNSVCFPNMCRYIELPH